ncbi:MAG TPA: efflux RND transporter permease subunit [Anaeromyxobacteraceae bacterium]|nr:efflux RND transporter permease subunit [Anaeromyxobacteraceae bacterium]
MIRTFISRPVFTGMLTLAVIVFGLTAYPRIGVDQFPEVEFPFVTVTTVLPGADPEAIERTVTKPLEEAFNTLPGLDRLRSVNVENVSQVLIAFELERNVDVAAQDVRDRVQATLSKLPEEIQTPVVQKFDIGAVPVAVLAVSAPLPIERLTRVVEDEVKPSLQQLQGVGAVELLGGRKREITVVLNPALIKGYGLTPADVVGALRAQSVDVPGGRTLEPGVERSVKVAGEARSVEALRALIIASPMGSPIRLGEVAEVQDGPAEARSAAKLSGQSAIGLVVRKQSGTNTVQVAERVKESLARVQARLPQGSRVALVVDGARFIRSSISAVQEDMILGGVLAVLVVLLFLRNLRSTLVSAVALPTSIIGTFAVMNALHFTFNVITMLALTLSIGLLIDDAIVVIENIVRHLEEGDSPWEAARKGAGEIALAVLAVTLSVVAVFVPVAFMEGIVGRFFYQFGVTVAVAVLISYGVSMTLTPMFSARVLKEHQEHGKVFKAIENALGAVESLYRRALAWVLAHRGLTIAGAVAVLAVTVALGSLLKFTFLPQQDMSMVKVTLELPSGTALAQTEREIDALAAQVRKVPGVRETFATAGGGALEEVNKGEIVVDMVPIRQRTYGQVEFKDFLRRTLQASPAAVLTVQDYNPMAGGGNRAQIIQFNLRSTDHQALLASAEKTRQVMLRQKGFVDVDTTWRSGKPQLEVVPDRERAAALGIPAAILGQNVRALMGGDKVTDYHEGGETYDVKVRLPPAVLADPAAVGAMPVRSPSGQLVELRSVAAVRPALGPSQIDHQAQMRQITLLADLKDYALGDAMGYLTSFGKKELPASIQYDFEGQARELGKAGKAFLVALLLGVVLVYIILAAQFESLVHPFTIMMALPFAVIGGIAGLLLARQYMSMMGMIGFIMLMGLVTKNGILLVEFTNQLRARGKSTLEALMEAGPIRLRPILMTSVAMIAGMIPVALARGDGAETRVPMAVAIIGGLVTSTALTLGIVPVVYSLVDSARNRVMRRAKRETPAAAQAGEAAHAPAADAAAAIRETAERARERAAS